MKRITATLFFVALSTLAFAADAPQRPRITGVAHIRHKETDRIGDLARELRKFGAVVEEFPDGLKITPPADGGAPIRGREGSAHGAAAML